MAIKVNGKEVTGFWGFMTALIALAFTGIVLLVTALLIMSPLILIGWVIWLIAN